MPIHPTHDDGGKDLHYGMLDHLLIGHSPRHIPVEVWGNNASPFFAHGVKALYFLVGAGKHLSSFNHLYNMIHMGFRVREDGVYNASAPFLL